MAEEKKDGDDLDIADTVGPAANYAIAKNFFNFLIKLKSTISDI